MARIGPAHPPERVAQTDPPRRTDRVGATVPVTETSGVAAVDARSERRYS